MIHWKAITLAALLVCSLASQGESAKPTLAWTYEAESNLYAAPLVADLTADPGLETVISDSEARLVRCISAQGKALWTYDGEWKKRLTTGCALSISQDGKEKTLAICGSDGLLCVFDAVTAESRWTQQLPGNGAWGGLLWTDLTGDGQDELVLTSAAFGVHTFRGDGERLWRYVGKQEGAILQIPSMPAACDIGQDGRAEVFFCGQWGPVALTADGALIWQSVTGDEYCSAPALRDLDGDGRVELICASRNDHYLRCFDAATGTIRQETPLLAAMGEYPGWSLASGDLDLDGRPGEIVFGDQHGQVYCIDYRPNASQAAPYRWVYRLRQATHGAVSLADVDGDEAVEVLVAAGDHQLYCLDEKGRLEWSFSADLRLLAPPTIADIDQDGRTDILFCGSDHRLYCLATGGRYTPTLNPWPSRRANPAQTAAVYAPKDTTAPYAPFSTALLQDGGFERDKTIGLLVAYPEGSPLTEKRKSQPRGWILSQRGSERPAWDRVGNPVYEGAYALRLAEGAEIRTPAVLLPRHTRRVLVEYCLHGAADPNRIVLEGLDADGAQRAIQAEEAILREEKGAWKKYQCAVSWEDATQTPHWITLAFKGSCHLDAVQLFAQGKTRPKFECLVNQVGYDQFAPKRFLVQSNWEATEARFKLRDTAGKVVYEGALKPQGRIAGHFGKDWGYVYYEGDFTALNQSGAYRLQVTLDGLEQNSWPFEIGEALIWNRTAQAAYKFFYYQRCGSSVKGFHQACHLDDAVGPDGKGQCDCWGGWHDAGDYNTYHNAPYVLGLLHAYENQRPIFDAWDSDGNHRADFLDEILWGGDHARRMLAQDGTSRGHLSSGYGFWGPPHLETDNIPASGDERRMSKLSGDNPNHHQAAVARIARLLKNTAFSIAKGEEAPHTVAPAAWLNAAEKSLAWALEKGRRGPFQLSTALDLYELTGKEDYATLAHALIKEQDLARLGHGDIHGAAISLTLVEAVRGYDRIFKADHSAALAKALEGRIQALLPLAENPFGVCTFGPAEKPNFFGAPRETDGWHVGANSYLLGVATVALLAAEYHPKPEYLAFAYNQINWVLGLNPFGVSLMEGCGDAFVPTYHHRYTFGGVARGAVPGSVINGVTWKQVGEDSPFLDFSGADIPAYEANECWLPHNTNYLNALSYLEKAREKVRRENADDAGE